MKRHSVTSHGTARSLANGPSGGGLRGNSPGIVAPPISLLSMGGVCGRSLTAGNSLHWKANMLPLFSIMTLWANCTGNQVCTSCNTVVLALFINSLNLQDVTHFILKTRLHGAFSDNSNHMIKLQRNTYCTSD